MNRILALLLLLVCLTGCTNYYSKYYIDHTGGVGVIGNPRLIAPTGIPVLEQGSDVKADCLRMVEDGYALIGESDFTSPAIDQQMATQQAKKVHAERVLLYSRYSHKVSGVMPITTPTTQTSYQSGSIYGPGGGYASYSGTSTTYGSKTTYMPYTTAIYNYYASFWAKTMPPALGVSYAGLTQEMRSMIGSNKGVCIIAVVKNSPAFNADLLRSDIVRKVNDVEVTDEKHFGCILDDNRGRPIKLEIFRNGQTLVKQVQLNAQCEPPLLQDNKSGKPIKSLP